jgi:hypothetical protein
MVGAGAVAAKDSVFVIVIAPKTVAVCKTVRRVSGVIAIVGFVSVCNNQSPAKRFCRFGVELQKEQLLTQRT